MLAAVAAAGALPAMAQAPRATTASGGTRMSGGGFSSARLARLHESMKGHVASGRMPGLVTLVSRRGETHVDAIGTMEKG
jgi:hypothetical protein